MISSDETQFELFNRTNRTFVRRLQTQCEHPFYFVRKGTQDLIEMSPSEKVSSPVTCVVVY